ncbi:MAG: hypothetical protein AABY27_01075 [Pseudomonadota bacterium]
MNDFNEKFTQIEEYLIKNISGDEELARHKIIKLVIEAIKEDIKAEKKLEKPTKLNALLDEICDGFKSEVVKNPSSSTAEFPSDTKNDFKQLISGNVQEMKNYLKEYAIYGVDNTYIETFVKMVKNFIDTVNLYNPKYFNNLEAHESLKLDLDNINTKTFVERVERSRVNASEQKTK